MIIIVLGLPGTGKSFFATQLAKALKGSYLNTDRIRTQGGSKNNYSDNDKLKVYETMLVRMQDLVRSNTYTILDGTFYKDNIRKKFIKAATLLKEDLLFIEVKANEELIKERLEKKRKYSEADLAVYYKIKKEFEPLAATHLTLRSEKDNIRSMLEVALDYIEQSK